MFCSILCLILFYINIKEYHLEIMDPGLLFGFHPWIYGQ